MECELCYEDFNRCERLPKVLQKCGHTFCETCVGQLVKQSNLECPYCRYKITIGKDEYPPNNFALLQAMDNIRDEREGKGISKYYKPSYQVTQSMIGSKSKKRDIYEYIHREHAPFYLRLNSVLDNGEAQYQETTLDEIKVLSEQDNPALVRQNSQLRYSKLNQSQVTLDKSVSLWRYSFHPNSFFSNYLSMRLGITPWLQPFKKHFTCKHKYGCIENLMRKTFSTACLWLIGKGAFNIVTGSDVGNEAIKLVKDNWSVAQNWSADEAEFAWIGLQTLCISSFAVYMTAKCWGNMLQSQQEDATIEAKDEDEVEE